VLLPIVLTTVSQSRPRCNKASPACQMLCTSGSCSPTVLPTSVTRHGFCQLTARQCSQRQWQPSQERRRSLQPVLAEAAEQASFCITADLLHLTNSIVCVSPFDWISFHAHRRRQRLLNQLSLVCSAASCAEWTSHQHREGGPCAANTLSTNFTVCNQPTDTKQAGRRLSCEAEAHSLCMHPGATMRGMSSRALAPGPVSAGLRRCGCTVPVQKPRRRELHTPGECEGPLCRHSDI
jgi:hypothetical protein